MTERRLDPSGDPGHGVPSAWRPPALPEDARRMGLDRNTVEGAWLELAAGLDRHRRSHLLVAWLGLLVFGVPVLLSVLDLAARAF